MKTRDYLLTGLAVGLLALLGCGKSNQVAGPQTEFYGVKVDLPKLDSEFASAPQEVRDRAVAIKQLFRYGQFPKAIPELEQLSKIPSLTESQKNLVNTLLEQTKQVISKVPPQPTQ